MALFPSLDPAPAAAPQAPGTPGAPFLPDLTPYASAPSPGQAAAAAWAQTPWYLKPYVFEGRGLMDMAHGARNVGDWITGQKPPKPDPDTEAIWKATAKQHPLYDPYKVGAELFASLPLGEGAGALAGKAIGAAPEGANLLTRALYAAPKSAAMGAAYGLQQPGGNPLVNAGIGAVAGPAMEGGANVAGKVLGATGEAAGSLVRRLRKSVPDQGELDSRVGAYLRSLGVPNSVTPRPTPPGVVLPTAVHANDPALLDLQGKERAGQRAVPFNELATQNNTALVNGLRGNLAPNPDRATVSTVAHELLQSAQTRARGVVKAAYAPFDAAKGGIYLERPPVQEALREAHDALLPVHREALPGKFAEVLNATGPLHLTNDIEDLSARLSDAIAEAPPHSPKARALFMARDALNKGMDASALAKMPSGEITDDTATRAWKNAKAANKEFRDRFPQGTARDTEARRWLSNWLTGQKDPTAFLKEASTLPSRAKAVLDAFSDSPGEREQMRVLMRNHYVSGLLDKTGGGIPGQRVLNADALEKARASNAALERTILTPEERSALDTHVQGARDNAKILQRTVSGSSETASLLQHQAGKGDELLGSGIVHAAAKVHPVAGALAHLLLPKGSSDAAAEALQSTLTNALLDPEVYNRVMGSEAMRSPLADLLGRLGKPTRGALTRGTAFGLPRAINGAGQ